MINFTELTRKTRFVHSDYTFEQADKMLELLPTLTPKFDGNWTVVLIDPNIKDVFELVDNDVLPSFVECYVYMNQSKLERIFLKYPKLIAKKQKPWDTYMLMLSDLNHPLEHSATKYLYKALSGDIDRLKEALEKLDANCKGEVITLKEVKVDYTKVRKATYASEVVRAFFLKDRNRWSLYESLVKDLGQSYAYYSVRKQVGNWLKDKGDYLANKETDNRSIDSVDAPFISYVYLLFVNSVSPNDLPGLMYEWDHRGEASVERRIYADIQ